MRISTLLAASTLTVLVTAACAHDRDVTPQTQTTTGAPVTDPYGVPPPMPVAPTPSPAPAPPSDESTTGTDMSPGSSTWGTSGNSGTSTPPENSMRDAGIQSPAQDDMSPMKPKNNEPGGPMHNKNKK